jgi:RNA polymerase sigma factor (sigma-70 family)
MALSESTAINALKNGNHIGMNTIIRLYQNLVYTIIHNIVKDNDDAMEASQDTFIKAYKAIDTYDEQLSFKSWLCKIAYRTAIDYHRKRSSQASHQEPLQDQHDITSGQLSFHHLEKVEIQAWIHRKLDQLTTDERTIIELFYLKEMTINEVAEIVEMTDSNIKTILHRTRKKLYLSMVNEAHQYKMYTS